MNIEQAQAAANAVVAILAPWCDRIEVAGSVRRLAPVVNDVEVVCIPKVEAGGLFGDCPDRAGDFMRLVRKWPRIRGDAGGLYTRRFLPAYDIEVDLFMAVRENWGYILAIRTGPAEYSHHVLARRWTQRGYRGVDGMLVRNNEIVPVLEERDLFALVGLPWAPPEHRAVPENVDTDWDPREEVD